MKNAAPFAGLVLLGSLDAHPGLTYLAPACQRPATIAKAGFKACGLGWYRRQVL